jgi:hypothetical protein
MIDSGPPSATSFVSGRGTTLRQAANRRNARKSTGPRTRAGKRRVALNALRRALCPPDFEREMRARREDPRDFRRLHRDLLALFEPRERLSRRGVDLMAQIWWIKARRVRQWIGSGPPCFPDLDVKLEYLLRGMVRLERARHGWWFRRLSSILGSPLGGPAEVRAQIEQRLFIFGAKPGRRTYSDPLTTEQAREAFRSLLEQLAGAGSQATKGGSQASSAA